MNKCFKGVVVKRGISLLLFLALAQVGYAQQSVRSVTGIQSNYKLVKIPMEFETKGIELGVVYHTVEKGETLESILMARRVAPTPRAVGFVLDANPSIVSADQIYAGSQIYVPEVMGAPNELTWFNIGAPSGVARLTNVATNLAERATQLDSEDERKSLESFANNLQMAVSSDAGLSASSIETLRANAQSILILANSPVGDNVANAASLARLSDAALVEVVSNSKSRNSNKIAVQVAATSFPDGSIPKTCRIKYAFAAYTLNGHVVPRGHTADFETSNCKQGKHIFEVGGFYGVWAEWAEGDSTRRSKIKDFKIRNGFGPHVDLPLTPFE